MGTKGTSLLSPLQKIIQKAKDLEQTKKKKKAFWSEEEMKTIRELAELVRDKQVSQVSLKNSFKSDMESFEKTFGKKSLASFGTMLALTVRNCSVKRKKNIKDK